MLFSQRIGKKPATKLTQREELDGELRIKIWNVLQLQLWNKWEPEPESYTMRSRDRDAIEIDRLMTYLWFHLFKLPLDKLPPFKPSHREQSAYGMLRQHVMEEEWYEVFDLLEMILKAIPRDWSAKLSDFLNSALQDENSAYRITNLQVVEITDENEIEALEQATSSTRPDAEHLKRALELLTDRKVPDYRNSMKESISAVESVCQEITEMPSATLNDCLKVIKRRHALHPAFEGSLVKLYGFTSDAGGIRHAMTDETEKPTFADAKFMLVSCAALVNYFRTVIAEA